MLPKINEMSPLKSCLMGVAVGGLLLGCGLIIYALSLPQAAQNVTVVIGGGLGVMSMFLGGLVVCWKSPINLTSIHDCPVKGAQFTENIGTQENHWQFCRWCGVKLTNIQESK